MMDISTPSTVTVNTLTTAATTPWEDSRAVPVCLYVSFWENESLTVYVYSKSYFESIEHQLVL